MADFTSYEAPARKAGSLPVDLPGKLHGRDPVLAQVYSVLKTNKPMLIYGAAGIGKTALAGMLASAYTELPGGALWLHVDNSPLEELIVRVGRAYGVDEITGSDTPIGMVGAAASTLTANKPLVVLDGRHNVQATTQFVSRCADGLPVLLVSKDPLPGFPALELKELDEAPAVQMFRRLAGLEGAEGIDDELDELTSILDYVPFALAVAAGTLQISKQTLSAYLQAFEQIPSSAGATPQLLALTVGFRALNNALQGILLVMGATFTGGASAELLSQLSGAPLDTVQQVMNMLAGAHLVEKMERADAPYYRLHEITYTFAQTWLRGSGRLETLQAKTRDTLLAYARKYSADSPEAFDKLAAEMDQMVALARWSAERGERDAANQLVVSLTQAGDFINERGYLYELLQLRQLASSYTTAFPAYPAPAAPPPPETIEDIQGFNGDDEEFEDDELADDDLLEDEDDEPDSLLELEEEYADELDEDEDYQEEEEAESISLSTPPAAGDTSELSRLGAALRQARADGETDREVELLLQMGDLQVRQGMDNEALTSYSEALNGYEQLDDPEGILNTLDKLTTVMVRTENSNAAIMHATRGIKLAEELEDDETRMFLLTALGDARQQNGESADAIRAYGQALEIARNQGDSQNEALILFKLGYAQLDSSDADTAAETWEQALKLFKAQGKRAYEGRVLGGLGTAYGDLGRWEESINFHTSALHIAREVGDREEEALELSNLGYASVQANQLGQAVLRYRQALHLAYQADQKEEIVSTIVDLARLLVESRRHLDIAELLVNDALGRDGMNRDLTRLKDRIQQDRLTATADGIQQLPVTGSARDYAANAYRLLEG